VNYFQSGVGRRFRPGETLNIVMNDNTKVASKLVQVVTVLNLNWDTDYPDWCFGFSFFPAGKCYNII
jgi:hypothetical protein